MNKKINLPLTLIVIFVGVTSLFVHQTQTEDWDEATHAQAKALVGVLPPPVFPYDNPSSPEKVLLGQKLFFDPRLSRDGTVSCVRCHLPQLYGTDGLAKSIGIEGRKSPRNAPTILNSALHFKSHWRGDRDSLEDQAFQALTGPASFGNPNHDAALAKLRAIPGYTPFFKSAFPSEKDPVSLQNLAKAIATYERTLINSSHFDEFIREGKGRDLSPLAKAGFKRFVQIGCVGCHSGPNLGGRSFQKFGLVENYWKATGSKSIDLGRFDLTQIDSDRFVFKVPSLRNIAMTGPYFHDGSVDQLEDAVRIMARVQLGKNLSRDETLEIVEFLKTLTGAIPDQLAIAPVLPK